MPLFSREDDVFVHCPSAEERAHGCVRGGQRFRIIIFLGNIGHACVLWWWWWWQSFAWRVAFRVLFSTATTHRMLLLHSVLSASNVRKTLLRVAAHRRVCVGHMAAHVRGRRGTDVVGQWPKWLWGASLLRFRCLLTRMHLPLWAFRLFLHSLRYSWAAFAAYPAFPVYYLGHPLATLATLAALETSRPQLPPPLHNLLLLFVSQVLTDPHRPSQALAGPRSASSTRVSAASS